MSILFFLGLSLGTIQATQALPHRPRANQSSPNQNQPQQKTTPDKKQQPLLIRVRLANLIKDQDPHFFAIKSKDSMDITCLNQSEKKTLTLKGKIFGTICSDGFYLCYGKEHTNTQVDALIIRPKSNHFVINGTPFQGMLTIKKAPEGGKPLVINTLTIDDYIYSVLRYEIFQSWPLEMQKVQAIASRTYVLHHLLSARKQKKDFDVQSSPAHQRYNGHHEFNHLRQAIEDTKNLILTFDHKPALTMFDACCGGSIPSLRATKIVNKIPYLKRSKQCTYCAKCPLYNWKYEIGAQEFLPRLKQNPKISRQLQNLGDVKEIKITGKDKAGVVLALQIRGSKNTVTIPGSIIPPLFRLKIKSGSFTLSTKKQRNQDMRLIFNGKGLGHQIGLCQRGAHELVKRGWHFREILNFYYPGTTLATLSVYSGSKTARA